MSGKGVVVESYVQGACDVFPSGQCFSPQVNAFSTHGSASGMDCKTLSICLST